MKRHLISTVLLLAALMFPAAAMAQAPWWYSTPAPFYNAGPEFSYTLINNYGGSTTPPLADSSQSQPCAGAKRVTVWVYAVGADSSNTFCGQLLFLSLRFGNGASSDSVASAALAPNTASGGPDTVKAIPIFPKPAWPQTSNYDMTSCAMDGETVFIAAPYDSPAGIVRKPMIFTRDVPVGATFFSVRIRPGRNILCAGGGHDKNTATFYRVDAKLGQ